MASTIKTDIFDDEFASFAQQQRDREITAEALESSGRASILAVEQIKSVQKPQQQTQQSATTTTEDTLGAVVNKVGEALQPRNLVRGVTEIPGAAIKGVGEAFADTRIGLFDASVGLQDWFIRHGVVAERSEDDTATLSEKRQRLEALVVNDEETLIGSVVHDIANFMAFFIPFVGTAKKASVVAAISKAAPRFGRIAVNAIAGGASEFAMTDTAQESILEIFRNNPEIRDHGLAMMDAADEDVPRLQRRLENALFGVGAGLLVDGFVESAKLLRSATIARRTAREQARSEAASAVREGLSAEERTSAIAEETARIKKELPDLPDEEAATQAKKAVDAIESDAKAQALLDEQVPRLEESDVRIGELGKEDPLAARGSLGARRIAEAETEIRNQFPELTPQQVREEAETAASTVEINFERINSEDDVKQLIQDVTDLFPQSTDRARRGVRTNVQTSAKAERLNIGLDEVLDTPRGKALNAEESVGYRLVWTSMASKVEELAKKAASAEGSAIDMFRYRKALSAFKAVNDVALGVRAEAGRTLQSWRITVGGSAERAQQLSALLDAGGGDRVSRKMAEMYLKGIRAGMTPGQINRMVKGMALPRGKRILDAIQESYVMGLLWSPKTHAANILSNTVFPMLVTAERAVAARISRLAGRLPGDGVEVGEALARIKGVSAGVRSALHLTAIADDVTRKQFTASSASSGSKLDSARLAISSERAGINITDAQGFQFGLGKAIDYWGAFGRTPGAVLGGTDDLFKVVSFSMEREALALRQAAKEGAQKGWDEKRTLERVAELIDDPPEHIRLGASDASVYATFQDEPGRIVRALMNFRNAVPGSFIVFPFLRTPGSLLNKAFERTPFAPVVGGWRADIAAGGARRDIALARLSVGTTASLMFADWAFEHRIQAAFPTGTGARRALQRAGEQADSLKIGDWSIQINRFDPFGMQLSLMANMQQLIEERLLDEEDLPSLTEIGAAITVSAVQSTTSKSWLNGVAQVTSAMQNPERRGESYVQGVAKNLLLPHATLFRAIEAVKDPTISDVNSVYDAVSSQIVGLSDRLPKRRNLWGEPIRIERINLITPLATKHRQANPVDAAIIAERGDVRDIGKSSRFDGVAVNFRRFPRVYETYVELSGNKIQINGKGAKDFLNDFVKTDRYLRKSKGPDGQRIKVIRERIGRYRRKAQREILRDPRRQYQTPEFQEFREFIDKEQEQARQLRRPLRLEDR